MPHPRPALPRFAVIIDAVVAAASFYGAARFPWSLAPGARELPADVGLWLLWAATQVAGVALAGGYARRTVPGALGRAAAGAVTGTVAAAALTAWHWPEHAGLVVFFALDGVLILASFSAWRAAALVAAAPAQGADPASPFVDRTTARATPYEMLASAVRYRGFLQNLVMRDLKLKYRGSVLGFMWSLLNPLAMVAAYTLAFQFILKAGPERYAFFVLLGLLSWSFFSNSASMSTNTMIESAGLLKAMPFPRAILPAATVLFNLSQYLLTIVVFLPVMLILYGLPPAWPMLAFPAVLALQVAFTMGVALALSAITTFFRDMRHLVEVALSILFWTTPVLYAVDQIQEAALRGVIALSPLSPYVSAYQRIFYHAEWPEPSTWLLGGLYAVAGLAVGSVLFYALEDAVGEQL